MTRPIGIGCMRLSSTADRDDDRAVAVLHAALDAGATFLDTADAYCLDDTDVGHNERLLARALATWSGDRARIVVATKGGLTRPGGAWVPDGRAKHLRAACEASRRALGVDRIALYQLHAPDPSTPFVTSVRALAALQRDGLIGAIGLCNVSRGQIEAAEAIAAIDSVQVELSLFDDREILSGVVAYCLRRRIRLIAHRPLGGLRRLRRLQRDPVLADVASRHGVTPADIALAWLLNLSDLVTPIPGPTRVETAARAGRAYQIVLTEEDRVRLDGLAPAGARLRPAVRSTRPSPGASPAGEIVLIMGLPAAGKSTVAASFVETGHTRLNRDESGGSLPALVPHLASLVAAGVTRFVADNTYSTRRSRAPMIEAATRLNLRVRGMWMATRIEDAQVNAVWRMVSRYGRLLDPGEIRQMSRSDPGVFGPGVLFRYQREVEPPEMAEGFAAIDEVPFTRRLDPSWSARALFVRAEGVLRLSRAGHRTPMSVDDLVVPAGARAAVAGIAGGDRVIALGWRPEIDGGAMSADTAAAIDEAVAERLGLALEFHDCPHGDGPPICWCRRPLPGLGVLALYRHQLDRSRCVCVGTGASDAGFARRCGFDYLDAKTLFGPPPKP